MRSIVEHLLAFACLSLLVAQDSDAAGGRELPGLEITAGPASEFELSTPRQIKELWWHLDKCKRDSPAFAGLLKQLRDYSDETRRSLKIRAMRATVGVPQDTFQTTHDIDRFMVDLDDLEVYPNPLKDGERFQMIEGVPPWAEFLCAALGHEIAEHLSMMKNADAAAKAGRLFDRAADRAISHYQVANPLSDRVSQDYFGVVRVRKDDCRRQHGDHDDSVWEVAPHGVLITHQTPRAVSFDARGAPNERQFSSGRLGYISYEPGVCWPGREEGSSRCRKACAAASP